MAHVQETPLPGVGIRYEFTTDQGLRLGVIVHRTGRREILTYDREDPDECRSLVRLSTDDAHTLVDLLGASQVTEGLASMQRLEGLAIDWLEVPTQSSYAGLNLREAAIHSETRVSIVAVFRGETTVAAPGPDFVLEAGDIAVAVGPPEGVEQLVARLHSR